MRNENDKYHQHYTYRQNVLKDRFQQLVLDSRGKLSKPKERLAFENTVEEWFKLISICKRDENFNDNYKRIGSYISAIYMYNGTSEGDNTRSDPFNELDMNMYQSIDNNGICFKHIDYPINKNAKIFKDLFQFEQANKYIASNLKANSCYFNLILATYKEAIESVYVKGERAYKDLTVEKLCKIMEIENKDQDLGLSIRASLKFFQKFHLGLVVVNIYDDVIFKYIPETKHKLISPHTLYVLVYNNHCFRLNSHERSFVQKI